MSTALVAAAACCVLIAIALWYAHSRGWLLGMTAHQALADGTGDDGGDTGGDGMDPAGGELGGLSSEGDPRVIGSGGEGAPGNPRVVLHVGKPGAFSF